MCNRNRTIVPLALIAVLMLAPGAGPRAENTGWVSLSCQNTATCGATSYGVTNDGEGTLAGYGWAENVGWISFSCANTASCGTAAYGVVIDPFSGDFSGNAWAETTWFAAIWPR